MNKKKGADANNKLMEIMGKYQEDMRTLIQQGELNHRSLEKHLSDVIDQLSNEVKRRTGELLEEIKVTTEKKLPLPPMRRRNQSKRKSGKTKTTDD